MNGDLPRNAGTTTRAAVRGDVDVPVLGPYQCIRLLGAGASGSVYAGIDTRDQRRIALKVLHHREGGDEEIRRRFLRECEYARSVHHPNVVEHYDAGFAENRLYLVMELLPGGDAAALCRRYPQGLPAIMIAAIGRDCARGLAAIHAAGLIHRDIKPSNIFLGPTGLAKLGDLGLSRHLQHSTDITVHGHLVGTPEFMAPEQALAEEELDHRADLFSLAASLYYFGTGRAPFEGGSAWAILAQLINDPFPDPRARNPDLPEALVQVIRKAGDKDRARRYQSALEMADALENVLSGGRRSSGPIPTVRTAKNTWHILVVDDDPIIRRVYRSRFELERWTVDTADGGTQALAAATAHKPDLILLDLMLGDADGLVVLRQLRSLPGLSTVPVVVFSNAFEEEQRELATIAGANRVLSKAGSSPRFLSHLIVELLSAEPVPAVNEDGSSATRPGVNADQLRPLAEASLVRLLVLLRDLEADDRLDQRLRILTELASTAHGLADSAGLVQHEAAALLAQAVEQLARQLLEWPDRITPSARRTITQAVLTLRQLLPDFGKPCPLPQGRALIVDDDPTSLRLAGQALEKVRIASVTVEDPQQALDLLSREEFSLILTDVMMTGMNGVQFATKVRSLEIYCQVPLIFVTSLTDFRQRLGDIGGLRLDAIAKPYLLIELATKALALRLG